MSPVPHDPLVDAFDRLTRDDVVQAVRLIDTHGLEWLGDRTGHRVPAYRYFSVEGREYPLKATGYLAAQLAAGVERTDGNPVKVDRVVRALCRCGFDVT